MTSGKRHRTHQVGVVLLVVLAKRGGGRDHQHHVAEDAEYLIVKRLFERQEVAELVLQADGRSLRQECCSAIRRACQ